MKIRSITLGVNLSWPLDSKLLARAGRFARRARETFAAVPLEVQTVRLSSQTLPAMLRSADEKRAVTFAQELEHYCIEQNIGYTSVGSILADQGDHLDYVDLLPPMLLRTESMFAFVQVASREGGIHLHPGHGQAGSAAR